MAEVIRIVNDFKLYDNFKKKSRGIKPIIPNMAPP
jgi:hypothetical protein